MTKYIHNNDNDNDVDVVIIDDDDDDDYDDDDDDDDDEIVKDFIHASLKSCITCISIWTSIGYSTQSKSCCTRACISIQNDDNIYDDVIMHF